MIMMWEKRNEKGRDINEKEWERSRENEKVRERQIKTSKMKEQQNGIQFFAKEKEKKTFIAIKLG